VPAETVTVSAVMSRSGGNPSSDTSTPAVSAMSLNECREPSGRTVSPPAAASRTISCTAATLVGRATRPA
jgi:hypothetical protein